MSMNILVTGASGGMGFSTCQQLVASGYTVYGLDRQEPDRSFSFRFLRADITDSTRLTAAFKRIKEEAGSLTAILHFTGVYDLNSLIEIPKMSLSEFSISISLVCTASTDFFFPYWNLWEGLLLQPANWRLWIPFRLPECTVLPKQRSRAMHMRFVWNSSFSGIVYQ